MKRIDVRRDRLRRKPKRRPREPRKPREPREPRDGPIRKLISWGKLIGVLRGQSFYVLIILGVIVALVWYFATK